MDEKLIDDHRCDALKSLQSELVKLGIHAYILTNFDEFLNVDGWRCQLISEFRGSNSLVLVTRTDAYFLTDARYLLSARTEQAALGYRIIPMKKGQFSDLINSLNVNIVHFDPFICSSFFIEQLKSKLNPTIELCPLRNDDLSQKNLIDLMFNAKPNLIPSKIEIRDMNFFENKKNTISILTNYYGQNQLLLLTKLEDIAYILGISGSDYPHERFVKSRLILHNYKIHWFIERIKERQIDPRIKPKIDFEIHDIDCFLDFVLDEFSNQSIKVIGDISVGLRDFFVNNGITIIEERLNKVKYMRAFKMDHEIEAFKIANVIDGVAISAGIAFLKKYNGNWLQKITEYDFMSALDHSKILLGADQLSFQTICGWNENSASIHYSCKESCSAAIGESGILLIDCGIHRSNATTDTSRTIGIGQLSQKMKQIYTTVLKGHMALANLRIDRHTCWTSDLDGIARTVIKDHGYEFAHSTGHGVGSGLNVHCDSIYVSSNTGPYSIPVGPRMLFSNEPGIYLEGEFGVRIENVQICKSTKDCGSLFFEQLTRVPYDLDLIIADELTDSEKAYIKEYHITVVNELKDYIQRSIDQGLFSWQTNLIEIGEMKTQVKELWGFLEDIREQSLAKI